MGKSWLDRLKDVTDGIGEVTATVVRTVGNVASDMVPKEIMEVVTSFSPQSIANLILYVDGKGMLNDPAAESLKNMADRIAHGSNVDPTDLFDVVPDLLRLPQLSSIVPAPLAARITQLAKTAKMAHAVGKMTGAIGTKKPNPAPTAPVAKTPAAEPETPAAAEPDTPAVSKPPRRRAPVKQARDAATTAAANTPTTPPKRTRAPRKAPGTPGPATGGEGLN